MIKNRTTQIIFQTAYCSIGLVGIIANFGVFEMTFWDDFYLHFTNGSNYLCFVVMLAELIQTAKKKADSNVTAVPLLKFIGLLGILLTFLVFNLLLAREKTRNPALNYKVNSVLFYIVLPILYIADWIFFYKRRETKWTYPVYSALFPIIYIIFIFSRACLLKFNSIENNLYACFSRC